MALIKQQQKASQRLAQEKQKEEERLRREEMLELQKNLNKPSKVDILPFGENKILYLVPYGGNSRFQQKFLKIQHDTEYQLLTKPIENKQLQDNELFNVLNNQNEDIALKSMLIYFENILSSVHLSLETFASSSSANTNNQTLSMTPYDKFIANLLLSFYLVRILDFCANQDLLRADKSQFLQTLANKQGPKVFSTKDKEKIQEMRNRLIHHMLQAAIRLEPMDFESVLQALYTKFADPHAKLVSENFDKVYNSLHASKARPYTADDYEGFIKSMLGILEHYKVRLYNINHRTNTPVYHLLQAALVGIGECLRQIEQSQTLALSDTMITALKDELIVFRNTSAHTSEKEAVDPFYAIYKVAPKKLEALIKEVIEQKDSFLKPLIRKMPSTAPSLNNY